MRVTPVLESELSEIAAAWNAALPHDTVSEKGLRRVLLQDPNYERGGVLVARHDDGSVLGLTACVVRRTVEGHDGGGRPHEFPYAFLNGFFVVEGDRGDAAADALLTEVEHYAAEADKRYVRVTMYTGPYVYPGLDVRYERLRAILGERRYRDIHTIEDVGVDLRDVQLGERLERARARVGSDSVVLPWRPELLPMMRRFAEEGNQAQWFPVGWESRYAEPDGTTLVLRRGEEIVGWAHYYPGSPHSGFGPTLVLDRERSKGYGSLLLLECMARARERGAEYMDAGWANTGFYVRNGWQIVRRFAVLLRALEAGG